MKSRTFCFNKTIFRKNVTLYWPIWVSFLLYELIKGPILLWAGFQQKDMSYPVDKRMVLLHAINLQYDFIAIMIMAIITGMAVWSYLFSAKSANVIHALPVTRRELYLTNMFSGWLFLFVPEILAFVLSLLVCLENQMVEVQYLFQWLMINLGSSFFMFSVVTACAMMVGQIFALPFLVLIGNVLIYALTSAASSMVNMMAVGVSDAHFNEKWLEFFSPIMYLMNYVLFVGKYKTASSSESFAMVSEIISRGQNYVIIYVFSGIALYVIGYLLYRRRSIECSGDLLSFGWIKPVFRWGVGICIGFFGSSMCYLGLEEFFSGSLIVCWLMLTIVLSLIGFFLAEMLIQKSFRVVNRKLLKEGTGMMGLAVVIFGCFYLCAYEQTNYVPDLSEIRYAYISSDYPVEYVGEAAEEVLAIQRKILAQTSMSRKNEARNHPEDYTGIVIKYDLTDGRLVSRYYELRTGQKNAEIFQKIYEDECRDENYLRSIIEYQYEKGVKIIEGQLEMASGDDEISVYRNLNHEVSEELYEAFLEDVKEGTVQKYSTVNYASGEKRLPYVDLNLNYYHTSPDYQVMYDRMQQSAREEEDTLTFDLRYGYSEGNRRYSHTSADSMFIPFGGDCRNLVRVLIKYGYIESEKDLKYYET